MKSLIVILLAITLMVVEANALAISPGRNVLQYEQGQSLEGSFSLHADRDTTLQLSVEGPLEPYLELRESEVALKKDEWREVHYAVKLPDVLPTENLGSLIVAKDTTNQGSEEGTFVSVQIAVATKVDIQFKKPPVVAPSQQELLKEGLLEVTSSQLGSVIAGEVGDVVIELANKGSQALQEVTVELIVFDMNGKELLRSASGAYTIPKNSKSKARIGFDASSLVPGTYKAKILVSAGGRVVERELTFQVKEKPQQEKQKVSQRTTKLKMLGLFVLFMVLLSITLWIFYRFRRRGKLL